MIHDVILHQLRRGYFRVEHEGGVLLEASDDASLDACRALLAKGCRGTLRTRHAGAAHFAMQLDIERGAELCTKEGPIRIVKRDAQKTHRAKAARSRVGGNFERAGTRGARSSRSRSARETSGELA